MANHEAGFSDDDEFLNSVLRFFDDEDLNRWKNSELPVLDDQIKHLVAARDRIGLIKLA